MTHTPHELAADFPEHVERIRLLKLTDMAFRELADRYHDLNRAIHRAETNIEPTDQFNEAVMRKERMQLKDRIASRLTAA